jgi:hypothetical protein
MLWGINLLSILKFTRPREYFEKRFSVLLFRGSQGRSYIVNKILNGYIAYLKKRKAEGFD